MHLKSLHCKRVLSKCIPVYLPYTGYFADPFILTGESLETASILNMHKLVRRFLALLEEEALQSFN